MCSSNCMFFLTFLSLLISVAATTMIHWSIPLQRNQKLRSQLQQLKLPFPLNRSKHPFKVQPHRNHWVHQRYYFLSSILVFKYLHQSVYLFSDNGICDGASLQGESFDQCVRRGGQRLAAGLCDYGHRDHFPDFNLQWTGEIICLKIYLLCLGFKLVDDIDLLCPIFCVETQLTYFASIFPENVSSHHSSDIFSGLHRAWPVHVSLWRCGQCVVDFVRQFGRHEQLHPGDCGHGHSPGVALRDSNCLGDFAACIAIHQWDQVRLLFLNVGARLWNFSWSGWNVVILTFVCWALIYSLDILNLSAFFISSFVIFCI